MVPDTDTKKYDSKSFIMNMAIIIIIIIIFTI